MPADRWPDDVCLSDIEPRFVCTACGKRGGDVRRIIRRVDQACALSVVRKKRVVAKQEFTSLWLKKSIVQKGSGITARDPEYLRDQIVHVFKT